MKQLSTNHKRHSWRLEDIAFDAVDVSLVRGDEFLFLTLASASFVEILAETYSDTLIAYFRDDREITDWLKQYWQQEEVQHGHALKLYVQTVWPEFDWHSAYDGFKTQYSALCTVEQLAPHMALELVARCVIETGTSSFYRAIQDYVGELGEPVLHQLIGNIKADEAGHYRHFRQLFARYNAIAPQRVWAVVATIWRRLRDARGEDVYIAFKHVYSGRHPQQAFHETDWRRYSAMVKCRARRHYPLLMAIKMLIKPIPIGDTLKRAVHWPMFGLARLWMLYR